MKFNPWRMPVAIFLALFAFAVWKQGGRQAVVHAGPDPQPAGATDLKAVTLVFGEKDAQPTVWDGSASISAGSIERIAGYHFTSECKINGLAWTCSSHPWVPAGKA